MFTGIIEEVGTVQAINRGAHSCQLTIQAFKIMDDMHVGDSIAVNGTCLTVTSFTRISFTADVMHETLDRSSLGTLRRGNPVNLERAMAANGRFGGHIVSGHIDGVGTIANVRQDDNAVWYTVKAPANILAYVVEKGSIAIEGISLTVACVDATSFSVSVIPHTRGMTNLASKCIGDAVNLECDIIGKYVERLLATGRVCREGADAAADAGAGSGGLTREFLLQNGF